MDRALRRHYAERMKHRVRWLYPTWNMYGQRFPNTDPRIVGINARTRKPCSNYCCGNPRKHFGELTKQERRANSRDRYGR